MKRFFFLFGIFLIFVVPLPAQQFKQMEFKDQPVTDILLALAAMSDRSIVPDETVSGNASYYFTETDLDTALKIFLDTYKMYVWKEGNIYYVSRVRAVWNKDTGMVSLDAEDVDIRLIVRAVSRAINKTILFDALPRENLTIHVSNTTPQKVLEVLVKRFPDYQVAAEEDYHYIKHIDSAPLAQPNAAKPVSLLSAKDGLYTINIEKARLKDILAEIFQKAGHEYSFFLRNDAILESLHFTDKGFEEILRLVLEQAIADFSVENGIYYVYEIQRADVLKKLKTIKAVPLTYVSVQDLPNLFPQDMAAQSLFRLDRNSNTIILSGSADEIGPIEDFIHSIDRPMEKNAYYRFDLSYLKVSDFFALLPSQLSGIKPVALPLGNSFVMLLSPENKTAMDKFLLLVDKKQPGVPIRLKYIQADYLLKNLPPSVVKEDVQQTGNSSLLFFTGSSDKLKQFLPELEMLDRPAPQIRYELLVVQYQNNEDLGWGSSVDYDVLAKGPSDQAFLGAIEKLLSLNFDIVSTFGYLFALDLSWKLSTTMANVLADTTVNGLSGQEIKFQNTNTSRYRDLEVNTTTHELQPSGVTREITSGLIISMNGWVSGDGMITMDVSATVSRTGTSAVSGNPPPTFEKVVNTHVRTVSGTPVVIGGLIQQDKTQSIDKVPILGDIPLLGLLFQSTKDGVENTEFVIYIVPHVEHPEQSVTDESLRMESLYQSLVKGR
jgi:type II secretory pathway component GspD/PulD (secretin)